MKKKIKGYAGFFLLVIIIGIFCAIGWVMNIVDIMHAISDPITAMFIIRCIGIFVFPVGALLGWFF